MDLANSSFFGLLQTRLGQLSERQRLISENIANASTPGFHPRDLDTSGFEQMLAAASRNGSSGGATVTLARTSPLHMTAAGPANDPRVVTRDDSETTIDGNAVVLEDEMAKAADVRMQFETGIALYQKGLELLRMATRLPGRG